MAHKYVKLLTDAPRDVIDEFERRLIRSSNSREFLLQMWSRGAHHWARFCTPDQIDQLMNRASVIVRVPLILFNMYTQALRYEDFSIDMELSARNKSLNDISKYVMSVMLDRVWRDSGVDEEIMKFAMDRFVYGTSFLMVSHAEEVSTYKTEEAVLDTNGLPVLDFQSKIPRPVLQMVDRPYYRYHTCDVKCIRPWQIYPDPDSGTSIADVDWVIHQEFMHIQDVIDNSKKKKWRNVSALVPGEYKDDYLLHDPERSIRETEDLDFYDSRSTDVLIHTIWDRRQGAVVIVGNRTHILWRGQIPYQTRSRSRELPFIQGRDQIELSRFWGMPTWRWIEDSVNQYQEMLSSIIKGTELRARPSFLAQKNIFGGATSTDQIDKGRVYEVGGGFTDVSKAITRIDMGGADPNSLHMANSVLEISNMVNAPQISGGTLEAELATQAMINQQQAQILDSGLKNRAVKYELEPLAMMIIDRIVQYMPSEVKAESVASVGLDESILDEVDIGGNHWDIKLSVEETKSESARRQLAMEQLNLLPGLAGSVPGLDMGRLVSDIWERGYGWKITDYINQEQAAMQQTAQQAPQIQGAGVNQEDQQQLDDEYDVTIRGNGRPMPEVIDQEEIQQ